MKIRTSELTELQLDYLIANIEGRTIRLDPMGFGKQSAGGYWIWEETPSGRGGILLDKSVYMQIGKDYSPSTKWEQAGPIIERKGINICIQHDEPGYKLSDKVRWYAQVDHRSFTAYGQTPLIAAMRCYVQSILGDEVDIPEVLA